MRAEVRQSPCKIAFVMSAILVLIAAAAAQSPGTLLPGPKPPDVPPAWKLWIGEYTFQRIPGVVGVVYVVSEKDGSILISDRQGDALGASYKIRVKSSANVAPPKPTQGVQGFRFDFDQNGDRMLVAGDVGNGKRTLNADAFRSARIKPVRAIEELRKEALAATPPQENGNFRKPDLVELAPLDASIHFDIRYATSNDFLGTPVYSQARAFLQRPAAEALVRAQQKLKPLGYGLLIHDAYRPWYVTKIFWDATPPEGKIFVADPAQGSRHNRGCAVDLTLYDLTTGKPIEMPGTYDEMSSRSFPDYPGGTSLQRWQRDLLRRAMESEGFTVYEAEWWHFDYKDWKEYPILNVPFEKLGLDAAGTMHQR